MRCSVGVSSRENTSSSRARSTASFTLRLAPLRTVEVLDILVGRQELVIDQEVLISLLPSFVPFAPDVRRFTFHIVYFSTEEVALTLQYLGELPYQPSVLLGRLRVLRSCREYLGVVFVLTVFLSTTGLAQGVDIVGRFPPLARAFVLGSGLLFVFTLGLAVLLVQ